MKLILFLAFSLLTLNLTACGPDADIRLREREDLSRGYSKAVFKASLAVVECQRLAVCLNETKWSVEALRDLRCDIGEVTKDVHFKNLSNVLETYTTHSVKYSFTEPGLSDAVAACKARGAM